MKKFTQVKEDREEGFYWVEMSKGEWAVALWEEDGWLLPGIEYKIRDEELLKIERRVKR